MNLSDLLKDRAYKLTQFKPAQMAALDAKRAVEIAIEQDVAAGMAYLAWETSIQSECFQS